MKHVFRFFSPRKFAYLIISLLVVTWMSNWFISGIPANPREENINDISLLWTLYHSQSHNTLFTSWNPLTLTGNTNYMQRGFFLLAPLAIITSLSKLPLETVYVLGVAFTFILSGIGIYEYMRRQSSGFFAALLAALVYMFLPPHLTLGLDAIEFNAYWALIPYLCLLIQFYIKKRNPIILGPLMGFLLALCLMTGTTYFIATIPFFSIFWGLQIYFAKRNSPIFIIQFVGLTVVFFLGTTAYITLPTIMEFPYMWISQESQRKNIFSILSIKEILELYILRLQNHGVTAWDFNRNHPDLGFYLGLSATLLSILSFSALKKKLKLLLPFFLLLFVFLGFASLSSSFVHSGLKLVVSMTLALNLQMKFAVVSFLLFVFGLLFYGLMKKRDKRVETPQLFISVIIFLTIVLILLNINRFQATFDHTVRVFIFPTFVLAVLTGWGVTILLKKTPPRYRLIMMVLIFAIFMLDLYPFSKFFKTIHFKEITFDETVYKAVSINTVEGRFYTPFPFKKHLPLYRYEYFTHFVDKTRLNNENLYTPFTPLYSTYLYDVLLIGALEQKNIDPKFFLTILDWGNTNYVILRREIADYDYLIKLMYENGWKMLAQNKNVIALVNSNPSSFIKVYPHFEAITAEKKMDPSFWYEKSISDIHPYEGKFTPEKTSNANSKLSDIQVVSWKRLSPTEITTTLNASTSSLVVASEAWYPGWQVTLDDQPTNLVRANYASLGSIVPKGKHTVTFTYVQPWYYKFGQIISLTTLLIFIVILFLKKNSES